MRKIQGVSFPRSGHHLLVRNLCDYFAQEMQCHKYMDRASIFDRIYLKVKSFFPLIDVDRFYYCEYYGHCQKQPCIDSRTTFQKNHNFELELPFQDDRYFLVQIRQPLPAIISWYEFSLKRKLEGVNDTKESWLSFFEEKLVFHKNFMDEWVVPGERDNLIIVRYEKYVNNPVENLKKVIWFFDPNRELDEERILSIVSSVNQPRKVSDFRYYDHSLQDRIQSFLS